jgi:hypothetical protein
MEKYAEYMDKRAFIGHCVHEVAGAPLGSRMAFASFFHRSNPLAASHIHRFLPCQRAAARPRVSCEPDS